MAAFAHKVAPLVAAAGIVGPSTGVLDPDGLPMGLALQRKPAGRIIAVLIDKDGPDWVPYLAGLRGRPGSVDDVAEHVEATPGTADRDDDTVLVVEETARVPTIGRRAADE